MKSSGGPLGLEILEARRGRSAVPPSQHWKNHLFIELRVFVASDLV